MTGTTVNQSHLLTVESCVCHTPSIYVTMKYQLRTSAQVMLLDKEPVNIPLSSVD